MRSIESAAIFLIALCTAIVGQAMHRIDLGAAGVFLALVSWLPDAGRRWRNRRRRGAQKPPEHDVQHGPDLNGNRFLGFYWVESRGPDGDASRRMSARFMVRPDRCVNGFGWAYMTRTEAMQAARELLALMRDPLIK